MEKWVLFLDGNEVFSGERDEVLAQSRNHDPKAYRIQVDDPDGVVYEGDKLTGLYDAIEYEAKRSSVLSRIKASTEEQGQAIEAEGARLLADSGPEAVEQLVKMRTAALARLSEAVSDALKVGVDANMVPEGEHKELMQLLQFAQQLHQVDLVAQLKQTVSDAKAPAGVDLAKLLADVRSTGSEREDLTHAEQTYIRGAVEALALLVEGNLALVQTLASIDTRPPITKGVPDSQPVLAEPSKPAQPSEPAEPVKPAERPGEQ